MNGRGCPRWCRPATWFWLGLVVLLPVHVGWIGSSEWLSQLPKPVGDGPDYENIAFHLYRGDGYLMDFGNPAWRAPYEGSDDRYAAHLDAAGPWHAAHFTTARPPLLPYLIAGCYAAFGRNEIGWSAVRILLAVCLSLSGAVAAAVTVKLLQPHAADSRHGRLPRSSCWAICVGGVVTLGFMATNRTLLSYTTDFLTEPLALLFTTIFIAAAVTAADSSGTAHASDRHGRLGSCGLGIVMGVSLGLMILSRSVFVLWLPAVGLLLIMAAPLPASNGAGAKGSDEAGNLWLARHARTLWQRVQFCLLTIAVGCLVCLPWWTRNVLVLERFMPLGTQGTIALLGGYNDSALDAWGEWQAEPERRLRRQLLSDPATQQLGVNQREILVARTAAEQIRVWARAHTWQLPQLAFRRMVSHWNPYSGPSLLWKTLAIIGCVMLLWHRRRVAWWLIGLPLASTLVVAITYTTGGRFLVPLYGSLFSLAGLGAAWMFGVFGNMFGIAGGDAS